MATEDNLVPPMLHRLTKKELISNVEHYLYQSYPDYNEEQLIIAELVRRLK